MKDVAKMAGVSQPTVSHVINNTAPISDSVREKVLLTIERLGYTPNAIAKSLKTKKTNVVGLIVPNVEIGYYAQIVKTVETSLRNEGMIIFLCDTFYDKSLEQKYIDTLIEHNVAGIIVAYSFVDEKISEKVISNNIPLVVIDDKIESNKVLIPSIEIDNLEGGKMAAQHLCNIGAKRICYVSEPLYNTALKSRFEGFKEGLKERGVPFDEDLCFIEKNQYDKIEMGYNLGANIVLDSTIDAVFASSDDLAFGIMRRLKEYNKNIPDDIALMGYDDVPMAKVISPELTTISQPKIEMAKKGVYILQKLINNIKLSEDEKEIILNPSLIIRKSTIKTSS